MVSSGPSDGLSEAVFHSAGEGCAVKLPAFEGPLDLLLHLIRLNEVDVTDIPIALIAEQYLEYLALMRDLNLDVAGEYLLVAATLAWIKSRTLLPALESEEDEEGIDPRAELVARLLEYQRFKEAAAGLDGRPLLERDVFAVRAPGPEATPDAEREIDVGLLVLLEAYRRVMRVAQAAAAVHEVHHDPVTVRERMLHVMQLLGQHESLEFERFFEGPRPGPPSRALLVASFLALLELARLGVLRIYQGLSEDGSPCGPIRLRQSPGGAGSDWSARISELM